MINYVSRTAHVEDEAENDALFVRSVGRAMAVLSSFHAAEHPLSLSEIARAADLDRSTTQRLVHTLRKMGYIRRDRHDRGFIPGIRIYDHALDAMRLDSLNQRAVPYLLELRGAVNERVDLSLFDDLRLVYVSRVQPERKRLHDLLVGLSVPAYCTSAGWAAMSKLPDETVRDIIRRSDRIQHTPRTIVDENALMDKVHQCRKQGYAVALEQLLMGEVAIAAAVSGPSGIPLGSVTITALVSDWSPEAFEQAMAPALMQTVRAISHA
ncbi:IclR family transcriptional regulator [Falsirhodobacter sp. alg1]|uniref:IclR family transcriptional regulator n=1 Tax=Falsirhodobacter sp. alg1 TaxID=1472418 RepID=UPI0005F07B2C|nr:IclR family transcriptional regulator [Falsirhodobacter sp. alg1]